MRTARALAVAVFALLSGCGDAVDSAVWSRFAHDPARLDSVLRARLGFPDATSDARSALRPLRARLRASPPRDSSFPERVRAIAAVLAGPGGVEPVLHPTDADLIPTLAIERGRGGCTSLSVAWMELGAEVGLRLEPVLLPGHMILREVSSGRLIEPLRGCERSPAFYDSAFQLPRRPAYAVTRRDPKALEAALAVQGGLLAWRAGRLSEAEDAFRTASSLVPGLPEAEGNLGLVLLERGQRDSAKPHLERALIGDSTHLAAARWLHMLR